MKNFLIIGPSSGIGRKLEDMLANSGNKVYGTFCTRPIQNDTQGIEYHLRNVLDENLNFNFLPGSLDGLVYCPDRRLIRFFSSRACSKIRVNCIAPSLTDNPLAEPLLNNETKRGANAQRHPLKRIGNANDIAEMAGFLISDKSGWITGQVFHVNGGISTLKT